VTIVDDIRARASERPDHPAVCIADRGGEDLKNISYSQLVRGFETQAAAIRAAGVGDYERCGLSAPQGYGFIETALGILAADACLVPLADQSARAAAEFARNARLHHSVHSDPSGLRVETLAADQSSDHREEAFRALQPAYLRFTSGTTSTRKGVILGKAAIAERLAAANRGMQITRDDRVLWLLPMAHHFVVSILLYLRHGATILLPSSSLAGPVLDVAQRGRASVLYASPYHYNLLAKDASDRPLTGVRLAVSTADGLRSEIATRFAARFAIPLVQALGIIEVGLPVMNTYSAVSKPTALGRPLPDYSVWLRDEHGVPVEQRGRAEHSGEICIRGPGLFDAYLEPWTPSAEILDPDGFRTGDQGWFDSDGDLHLAGRRANRINMAGMKFFCEEVEAVLDGHPGIARSRVVAREHPHLGEIPVADVVPESGVEPPSQKELSAYCREMLPTYKVPRQFRLVEALPMTATGKLKRPHPDSDRDS
jgi:long-chain acyl-CoA synthetase